MTVICSWCESEGRPAVVREKAPLTDRRETHGICSRHLQQMRIGRDPLVPGYEEGSSPRYEPVVVRRKSELVSVVLSVMA